MYRHLILTTAVIGIAAPNIAGSVLPKSPLETETQCKQLIIASNTYTENVRSRWATSFFWAIVPIATKTPLQSIAITAPWFQTYFKVIKPLKIDFHCEREGLSLNNLYIRMLCANTFG